MKTSNGRSPKRGSTERNAAISPKTKEVSGDDIPSPSEEKGVERRGNTVRAAEKNGIAQKKEQVETPPTEDLTKAKMEGRQC